MLVGSGHSADTLRLKAFLVRNGHPHVYLDVERDAGVDALLEHFQIGLGDIPALMCRHVFSMTGADANTRWLGGCLALDEQRFVKTL